MRALLSEASADGLSLPFLEVPLGMIDDHWIAAACCYVAVDPAGQLLAMYRMGPNMVGGGSHVCSATYVVASSARRRGLGKKMVVHSLQQATKAGYDAMQFNYVIDGNDAALKLYESLDFIVVGRLPGAFDHAVLGKIDALVLFRQLDKGSGVLLASERPSGQS
jgi:ribosomal protein S18 acetylase RimI-like enzyme